MGEFDHIAAAMQASPVTAAFMEMTESNDFSLLDKNTAKRHHEPLRVSCRLFGLSLGLLA